MPQTAPPLHQPEAKKSRDETPVWVEAMYDCTVKVPGHWRTLFHNGARTSPHGIGGSQARDGGGDRFQACRADLDMVDWESKEKILRPLSADEIKQAEAHRAQLRPHLRAGQQKFALPHFAGEYAPV